MKSLEVQSPLAVDWLGTSTRVRAEGRCVRYAKAWRMPITAP